MKLCACARMHDELFSHYYFINASRWHRPRACKQTPPSDPNTLWAVAGTEREKGSIVRGTDRCQQLQKHVRSWVQSELPMQIQQKAQKTLNSSLKLRTKKNSNEKATFKDSKWICDRIGVELNWMRLLAVLSRLRALAQNTTIVWNKCCSTASQNIHRNSKLS